MWAWILAAVSVVSGLVIFPTTMAGSSGLSAWGLLLMGLAAGTVLGGYLLLIGYVNRDAGRRGMSALLWTLVAIFIPNGLGILLYFILRQPLEKKCPQCGCAVQAGFNFCPRCHCKLSGSCPQCQRLVGKQDVYCPYCGSSLGHPLVAEGSPAEISHR